MSAILRPCPFCNGEAKTFGPYGWYRQWGISHSCAAFYSGTSEMMKGFPDEASAVAAWSSRAPSPAMQLRAMETAPKNGTDILVYYDHDADPYQDPNNSDRLTDYAAWAEGGPFMDGKGWCIAAWKERHWESTDEYGSGYWMPAYWFAHQNGDYEVVVNPVAWMPLPTLSEGAEL